MTELEDILKGVALGFAVAAPVGPIGVLNIRRTLSSGFIAGVIGGLGTALADGFYAAVAAFGITAISTSLAKATKPLEIAGIITLVWIGVRSLRSAPKHPPTDNEGPRVFTQMFLLTLANPTTVLTFAVLFAGLGVLESSSTARATALVAGTFAGSMTWWIILSGAVGVARERMTPKVLRRINHGAGVALLVFAAVLAARLIAR